ncbi:MAG: DNA mismatch repair endonuclease MutL [Lachnospiraceae bacterium]|nr:DNA mismatch repair endonuclease MutL [Lachnospiraceae bacterium]
MPIQILDNETIDKIAAGEVVERPSSVVKELVENSIDAGASAITVEIKDGGISYIRVSDNGCGIPQDDLRKAFLRHATSKIKTSDDLSGVKSLGFRGEALSSIAAVSMLEVITKTETDLTGVRICMDGAVESSFEEVGAPTGTTFFVRNIFFNTPVRKKFLKSAVTEGGYISDLMEHLALSHPDIAFQFTIGSQTRFHTSGNGDMKEVIYRIYGREVANAVIPIDVTKGDLHITGYLGKPEQVRSNRNFEIYFINGRFIRSNLIARAIEEGFREYLMLHKFPVCFLSLNISPENVDVNVHPTKMDVRFSDGPGFFAKLSEAIFDTLKAREMIPGHVLDKQSEIKKAEAESLKEARSGSNPEPFLVPNKTVTAVKPVVSYGQDLTNKAGTSYKDDTAYNNNTAYNNDTAYNNNTAYINDNGYKNEVTANPYKVSEEHFNVSQVENNSQSVSQPENVIKNVSQPENRNVNVSQAENNSQSVSQVEEEFFTDNAVFEDTIKTQGAPEAPVIKDAKQTDLFEDKILTVENRAKYRIIGQVFETFWLIQYDRKLFIIDQHAAHEKVNYERMMKRFRNKEIVSQTLLPPIIVSLNGAEENVYLSNSDAFASLGFEVEHFGGNEYALRAVPVDLYGHSEKELFLTVLDELAEGNSRGSYLAIEEKIAGMACKASIKGGDTISRAEVETLIDELLSLENPYNCPHGRPTIIVMTETEMEKKFKRIVD